MSEVQLAVPLDLGLTEESLGRQDAPVDAVAGLSLTAHRGAARRVAAFVFTTDGLQLSTALDGGTFAVAPPVPVRVLADALRRELDPSIPPLAVSSAAMGVMRDLAMAGLRVDGEPLDLLAAFEGVRPEVLATLQRLVMELVETGELKGTARALEVGSVRQWWHLFEGEALEIRVHLAPPVHGLPGLQALQLLLIGPPGRRAVVFPGDQGVVHVVSPTTGVFERFVAALEALQEGVAPAPQ